MEVWKVLSLFGPAIIIWLPILKLVNCLEFHKGDSSLFEVRIYSAESGHTEPSRTPIIMYDKEGNGFRCYLPKIEESNKATEFNADALQLMFSKERIDLLKNTCFYLNVGWWTYLICPGRFVKQFHVEGTGKIDVFSELEGQFMLGNYVQDQDFLSDSETAERYTKIQSQGSEKVFTQTYHDGTDGRKTNIYYRCGESNKMPSPKELYRLLSNEANQTDIIESFDPQALGKLSDVLEDPIHQYHLLVETPLLCNRTEMLQIVYETQIKILAATKHCIRPKNMGWWTYEVCPGKQVTQFHISENGNVEQLFNLGDYNKDLNYAIKINGTAFARSEQSGRHTYLELYEDGTPCDMTSLPRSTEVRYTCLGKNAKDDLVPEILTIEEGLTCNYTITVNLPSACELEEEFNAKQLGQSIDCFQIIRT
mmetsp:Transcript_27770/g.35918  ORF Transcript_27770/g.35918 Transcript_27770/m.35918 type:complete len:423 (-) Transcript_27770:108-1376(-)